MNKQEFLQYMQQNYGSNNPILRSFLSSEEIRLANQLVKEGKLEKGCEEGSGRVIYYAPLPTWKYSN